MVIGYTTGVFDLFHIGHLNMLKNASSLCDKLIVGVTTDERVVDVQKKSIIRFEDRLEIVRNVQFVDAAIPQDNPDVFEAWEKLKFDIIFVGDDWYDSSEWKEYEGLFENVGVRIIYIPNTKNTSSATIQKILNREGTINFK